MTLNLGKLFLILVIMTGAIFALWHVANQQIVIVPANNSQASSATTSPSGGASVPAPYRNENLPEKKTLAIPYHTFQSFNNCAPAALSIALSYYGVNKTQQELMADLRPYNNPQGINDDKSTTPDELAEEAKKF